MSTRAKKRLWGGRPRSEDHRPTTFFSPYRAAILHYPDAFRFIRLCSCRARTKSGVREPSIGWDPRRQSRPHPIEGTRAYSRLRTLTPFAPVIRGHMCLVCQKSRFSSCSPFASGEQSAKNDNRYPLAPCCLCGSCRACTTINRYPLAP